MKIKAFVCLCILLLAVCSAFNLTSNTTFLIPPKLMGSWKVVQFYGSKKDPLIAPLNLTMIIEEGGISNGFMGCNKFRTDCKVNQDSLLFGTITSTRKFCTKEYMDIEDQFRYALTHTNRYEIHKDALYLMKGNRTLVQFIKQ